VKQEALKLGALGGPTTFNARAAKQMVARYPQFGAIVYLPTSEEVVQAALRGEVDAACAPEQTSAGGFHAGMLARMVAPESPLYVIAETARRYDCSLLGKPGARLAGIRRVLGHDGSMAHCRAWLEKSLPQAEIEIVGTHSEFASEAVLKGDGSIASVGSPDLATAVGLVELAGGIDNGSAANYWAVSTRRLFPKAPTRLLVNGRFGDDAKLGELVSALAGTGFLLGSACPRATGFALHEYDYMLRFRGRGVLASVETALAPFVAARLAGAWEARD
jgi:prephenate dehydratase